MGNYLSNATYPVEESINEGSSTSAQTPNFDDKNYRDPQQSSGNAEKKKPFVDPRSISDDVNRTPISKEEKNEASADREWIQNKMKSLAIDPRSPSGIPRTPIIVEDEDGGAKSNRSPGSDPDTPLLAKGPSRGQHAKKKALLPASKLSFEPEAEKTKEQDDIARKVAEKKKVDPEYTLEEGEIIDDDTEDESENVKPKTMATSASAITIRPNDSQNLLIEEEAVQVKSSKGEKVKVNSRSRLILGEIGDEDNVQESSGDQRSTLVVKRGVAATEDNDNTMVI